MRNGFIGLSIACGFALAGCVSGTVDSDPKTKPAPAVSSMSLEDARQKAGVAPLIRDAKLTKAAQKHASDMARRGYYAHVSPEGVNFDKRIRDAGYCVASYSENLTEKADSEAKAIQMWMASPAHRRNMLNPKFTRYGLGNAGGYWVLDLAGPCVR